MTIFFNTIGKKNIEKSWGSLNGSTLNSLCIQFFYITSVNYCIDLNFFQMILIKT